MAVERVITLTGDEMEVAMMNSHKGKPRVYTQAEIDALDPVTFGVGSLSRDDGVQYWSDGVTLSIPTPPVVIPPVVIPPTTPTTPQAIKKLTTTDSLEGVLLTATADGEFVYSRDPSDILVKYDKEYNKTVLKDMETLLDADGVLLTNLAIIYMANSCSDGTLFMVCRQAGLSFLYKSIDNGVSFGANFPLYNDNLPVFRVGWDGTTHLTDVTILGDRGFAEIKEGGKTFYAFGEYDTSPSGGYGDPHIVVSGDDGNTWNRTISLSMCRHIHYIKQDPYHGHIWIGAGDTNEQSAIVRIDSITRNAPSGMTHEQLNNSKGFKVLTGGKEYATTDLHFEPNHIINPCDSGANSTEAQVGIWKFDYDMTYYTKVADTFELGVTHSQYWITEHKRTKTLITVEILEENPTNPDVVYIRSSNDGGLTWEVTASTMLWKDRNANAVAGMLEWNDQVWLGGSIFAGPYPLSSWAITPSGTFDVSADGIRTETDLDGTVHNYGATSIIPAAFIADSIGSDVAGFGYSPRTPFKTLERCLESSRCTYGHNISIIGNLVEVGGITSNIQSAIRPAVNQPMFPLTINGTGRLGAEISGAFNSYLFRVYAEPRMSDILVRNVNYKNTGFGQFVSQSIDVGTRAVRVYDSHIENGAGQAVTGYRGDLQFIRSTVKNSNGSMIGSHANGGGSVIQFMNCFLDAGGTNGILPNNTQGDIWVGRSTLVGFSSTGVRLVGISEERTPKISNTLIYSELAATSVQENTAVTYNSGHFDNVIANLATSEVAAPVIVNATMSIVGYRTAEKYGDSGDSQLDIELKEGTDVGCFNI